MTMADTIAVMNGGRLQQVGDPGTLYEKPESTFAANFLGQSNLLSATVKGVVDDIAQLNVHGTAMTVPAGMLPEGATEIWLGIRPEKVRILGGADDAGSDRDGLNTLSGKVTDVSFLGVATQYLVATTWGRELTVVQQNDGAPRALLGSNVRLAWLPGNSFALDASQDADAGADIGEDA